MAFSRISGREPLNHRSLPLVYQEDASVSSPDIHSHTHRNREMFVASYLIPEI